MFTQSVNPNQSHPESLHCCCGAASLGVDFEVSEVVLEELQMREKWNVRLGLKSTETKIIFCLESFKAIVRSGL